MLVADSLRLGGAILGQYPDMLAPQLVGRDISFSFKKLEFWPDIPFT